MLSQTFFHVGIVVARLEESLEHLAATLGVRFAPTTVVDSPVLAADGTRTAVPLRFAYSLDAPHLEVIEEVPGSVWVCNPHSNLHHIGYWAEDFGGEHRRLVGSHCPVEIAGWAGADPDPALYTYHADPLGIRVELVDAALRPLMEAGWEAARAAAAGGDRS